MAKKDIVQKIAKDADIPLTSAEKAFESFVEYLVEEVKVNGKTQIPNIGSFRVKKYEPRLSRNPKTGEVVNVPARSKVKFTMSKFLNEFVNS